MANSTEEREAFKLVEVVKDYMLSRAKKFVADCDGRAVLFSYGSDGTPLLTRANFSHVLDGEEGREERWQGRGVPDRAGVPALDG